MSEYRIEYKLIFGNGTKSGTNVGYAEAENQREAELVIMARNEHECVVGLDFVQVSVV